MSRYTASSGPWEHMPTKTKADAGIAALRTAKLIVAGLILGGFVAFEIAMIWHNVSPCGAC